MSSVSAFLSKDAHLRRQARLNRTRKNGTRALPSKIRRSLKDIVLEHIPEENLDSSQSPPAPTMPLSRLTTRARRRHALNVPPPGLGTVLNDITEEVVTLTDVAVHFPMAPLPTPPSSLPSPYKSPSPMSSSAPSSPDSQSENLPLTPSSSDDEFPLPSPIVYPRRVTIKPLVIHKVHLPPALPMVHESDDSDADESDSEWYTREFSNFVSLSPVACPTSFSIARRDSTAIAPTCDSPLSPPHRKRRQSGGLRSPALPSLLSPRCRKTLSIAGSRRPPPRMSIPDDACSPFSLSFYLEDLAEPEPSPLSKYSQVSAHSYALDITKDEVEETGFPDDFEVQVDCPMMLPLSIPGTPIDLEADIAHGLEEFWKGEDFVVESSKDMTTQDERGLGIGFILEEAECSDQVDPLVNDPGPQTLCPQPPHLTVLTRPSLPPTIPLPPLPLSVCVAPPQISIHPDNMSTTSIPSSPHEPCQELSLEEDRLDVDFDERKHGLKSRWSSSTLGSLSCEENSTTTPKFSGATKLRMYFQSQHKRSASAVPSPTSPKSILPSMTPSSLIAKAKEKKDEKKEKEQKKKNRRDSESILIVGYHNAFSGRPTNFCDFDDSTQASRSPSQNSTNSEGSNGDLSSIWRN